VFKSAEVATAPNQTSTLPGKTVHATIEAVEIGALYKREIGPCAECMADAKVKKHIGANPACMASIDGSLGGTFPIPQIAK